MLYIQKSIQSNKKLLALVLAILLLTIGGRVSAQSFTVLNNSAQAGMLMSLTANPGVVSAATPKTASSLVGVLAPNEPSLDAQPGQQTVKTDGVAQTLVSTLDGDIVVGDRIAVSTLVGVGTKLKGNGWIVGTAQASLDSHTNGVVTTTVSDQQGHKRTIYVATIPTLVKIQYYANQSAATSSTSSSSVQAAVDSIAGRHASKLALILSSTILLIGMIMSGLVVYSAIRGGLLAVSRQPLTKTIIIRKMVQAIGVGVTMLLVSVVGAFLLLRLLS